MSPKKLMSGTTSNPRAQGKRGVRRCWLGQQNRCKVFQLGPPQNKVVFNLDHFSGQHRSWRSSAATVTGEEVAGQGRQHWWLCGHPWQHCMDAACTPKKRSCSCGTQRQIHTLKFPTLRPSLITDVPSHTSGHLSFPVKVFKVSWFKHNLFSWGEKATHCPAQSLPTRAGVSMLLPLLSLKPLNSSTQCCAGLVLSNFFNQYNSNKFDVCCGLVHKS